MTDTTTDELKQELKIRLSNRAADQLVWLVDNLFTTYGDERKTRSYFISITLERAISDMYEKHVREL